MSWSDLAHRGETYALVCALLWAFGVILFRRSGEFLSPVVLNAFKSLVGLLLFLLTDLILGVRLFPPECGPADWVITLSSGVAGIGLADTFFFRALNAIGAGRVAIVDCLYSPSVILCAFFYLREPMPWTLFLAVAMMVVAILLGVFEPGSSTRSLPRGRLLLGAAYATGAIFLTAAAVVALKPILERSDVWWVSTVRLFAGVAFLFAHVAGSRHRLEVVPALHHARTWRVALPAAIVGTYLGFLFWNLGMKYTYATTASLLNQTSNILVLPLAWVFLHEPLGLRQWLAVLIGFTAAAVAML